MIFSGFLRKIEKKKFQGEKKMTARNSRIGQVRRRVGRWRREESSDGGEVAEKKATYRKRDNLSCNTLQK